MRLKVSQKIIMVVTMVVLLLGAVVTQAQVKVFALSQQISNAVDSYIAQCNCQEINRYDSDRSRYEYGTSIDHGTWKEEYYFYSSDSSIVAKEVFYQDVVVK